MGLDEKHQDEMSTKEFEIWKDQLDRICSKIYCVNTQDMGFDDLQLRKHWLDNETAQDTAEYFGSKFNLTRAEEINWGKPFD